MEVLLKSRQAEGDGNILLHNGNQVFGLFGGTGDGNLILIQCLFECFDSFLDVCLIDRS